MSAPRGQPPPPADPEALERAAIEWLCEGEAGFSPERAAAFAAWRQADPRHEQAVRSAQETMALLATELPGAGPALEARLAHREPRAALPPPRRAAAWAAVLAAAAVLGVAVWVADRPEAQEVITPAGPPRLVPLADGSILDVKEHSRLQVELTADARRVVLHRGEAHFIVAPDPARPFTVEAGGMSVRAVGTAFNVALAPTGLEVVVVEGKVSVARTPAPRGPAGPPVPIVAAGERAWVDAAAPVTAPVVERLETDAIARRLAWRKRTESFADVPLPELVARFNQVNVTRLVLGDDSLAAYRVGGTFELDHVDAFVGMLERAGDIVAERPAENTIVLRRAR